MARSSASSAIRRWWRPRAHRCAGPTSATSGLCRAARRRWMASTVRMRGPLPFLTATGGADQQVRGWRTHLGSRLPAFRRGCEGGSGFGRSRREIPKNESLMRSASMCGCKTTCCPGGFPWRSSHSGSSGLTRPGFKSDLETVRPGLPASRGLPPVRSQRRPTRLTGTLFGKVVKRGRLKLRRGTFAGGAFCDADFDLRQAEIHGQRTGCWAEPPIEACR